VADQCLVEYLVERGPLVDRSLGPAMERRSCTGTIVTHVP